MARHAPESVSSLPIMARQPNPRLLDYLAPYDPRIASLALALREVVLEEAPEAIESLVNGYAVVIGFSFTGKPMKDGFCHVVTHKNCVNLGFNRGALLADAEGILEGSGKLIRHLRIQQPRRPRPPSRAPLPSCRDRTDRPSRRSVPGPIRENHEIRDKAYPPSKVTLLCAPD
ncbi:MAG: DUF1801 domain-containing protein [Terracidiphilus sp.]